MNREDVQGWCLGRDAQGAPTLSECALMRGVEGRYFAVMNDREGNPLTVRTYQRGETFFESKESALRELFARLSNAVVKHQNAINYLEEQVQETLELLEEAGDAERD